MPKPIDVVAVVEVSPVPDLRDTHANIELLTANGALALKVSKIAAIDLFERLAKYLGGN
jgi:hypothetical protein